MKWVLVTGASTGIGRAITEYLAEKGFGVYAGARKQADINDLNRFNRVEALKLDVTSETDIQSALSHISDQKTGLFGIVNNAGISKAGPLIDVSIEDMREQFEANLFSIHNITRAFFPLILETRGRIVMMSSNSGFFAAPFMGPYNASKFALEGYGDTLRRELSLDDIPVILIQPGSILTPIWDKAESLFDSFKESRYFPIAEKFGKYAIESGRTKGLPPKEVAKAVFQSLTVSKPRNRYLVAPDMFRNRMLNILPSKIVDGMIAKALRE